jgi:hypothetical protein
MTFSLETYVHSFAERLESITLSSLRLDAYPRQYLQLLLDNRIYYLHIYAHVLKQLLTESPKTKEEIVLVDYGAGNGLLGMFAKHCGFSKVYLNDISSSFLQASKQVSEALSISIDGFIEGDCEAVLQFAEEAETPDAVVGTDVIEHIYMLHPFFNCIKKINDKMITVFTTASVTGNPLKNYQLKKLQLADEHTGSNAQHTSPGNEFAGLPFLQIRKKIIERSFPSLALKEVQALAVATRGMRSDDIIKAGNRFISSKVLPKAPTHPTNTCDPITGSWTERLLPIEAYRRIYGEAGFSLSVQNGFYNQWQGSAKGTILKLANHAIALLGKQGKVVTPFITLLGCACQKHQ